jgi:predicted transport protein
MIFLNKNGSLEKIKEVDFKLEKEMQILVEQNLNTLFNLKYLATEFSIERYRFDTVAFNDETNSFVIIEFKRGRNESLVDQGYAYLSTLLNRKADFVLLYNECLKVSKSTKDFDWTQTRIYFISTLFTDYQKNATDFSNMPFELYEIKQFANGLFLLEEIEKSRSTKHELISFGEDQNSEITKVKKEIIVYTEDIVLDKGTEITKELYANLKSRILDLGNITIEPRKLYIAFIGRRHICDIEVQKKKLIVTINVKQGDLKDPTSIATDVSTIGHWGNGDYQVLVSDYEILDYLMTLIRQSHKINS